jgi:hypothetical protein
MGSGASIGDLTAEEIGEQVASLGNSYIPYKEKFLNNGSLWSIEPRLCESIQHRRR